MLFGGRVGRTGLIDRICRIGHICHICHASVSLVRPSSVSSSQTGSATPLPCSAADALPLDVTGLWRGDLTKGQTRCFILEMAQGSFARLRFGLEKGRAASSLFAPAASTPASSATSTIAHIFAAGMPGYQHTVLSWAAAASGSYLLTIEAAAPSQGVYVQLESLESSELYAARAKELQADPRVRSLSNHMIKLKSVDPGDVDFSDLGPLRETLKGVRMVLLGEASFFDSF